MAKRIKENLDYTFEWRDAIAIDRMMKSYINDRENLYAELFNSDEDFDKEDVIEYVDYFLSLNSSDMDVDNNNCTHHKYLHNIHHFLERQYLYTILPSYEDMVANINDCLYYCGGLETDEEINAFVESEGECIENLKTFWHELLDTLADYPMLHLEKMNKTNIQGILVYYDKNTQPFVLNEVTAFLQDVKRDFPTIMKRFDTLFILDNDYLRFLSDDLGGEDSGTQAFYVENSIYIKAECDNLKDDSEKFFYREVLRHEFGHRVFDSLPEYLQIFWEENYKEWKNKGLKMCRDDDRNSQKEVYCQELFADCMAVHYLGDEMSDEDYIHDCSSMIMDVFEFIIRKGFENNK